MSVLCIVCGYHKESCMCMGQKFSTQPYTFYPTENPDNIENITFGPQPIGPSQLARQLGSLGGVKFDQDKIRLDLVPTDAVEAIAEILTFGAKKYGDRNWEKGMNWSRPYGALLRHLFKWWAGEDKDPETGKSHLWHAGCCIMFLISYESRNVGKDDRYKNDTKLSP